MLNLLTACFIFLITAQWSPCFSADAIAVADPLAAKITAITDRMAGFLARGYDAEADRLARLTTTEALACTDRDLSGADEAALKADLYDAFLKTELFQAFNTRFGSTQTHDHRIVYDFLKTLDKARAVSDQEKAHLTKLTVLSLAAQEFFWNPNSTVMDLKNRVRRELRFGLFRQAGNILDVSASIYLPGNDRLIQIIDEEVTDGLRGTLRALLDQFLARGIGATYTALLASLTEEQTRNVYTPLALNTIAIAAEFGIVDDTRAVFYRSSGAGVQCGFNSLFVPTEDTAEGDGPGTAREKMIRSLEDDMVELKRLHLYNSSYSEPIIIKDVCDPLIESLRKEIEDAETLEKRRITLIAAKAALEAEKQYFNEYVAENERSAEREIIVRGGLLKMEILSLQDRLVIALQRFKTDVKSKVAQWANNPNYGRVMKCIGLMGLQKKKNSEFFDDPLIGNHQLGEFFAGICKLVENDSLATDVESAYNKHADFTAAIYSHYGDQVKRHIFDRIIPLVEQIDPAAIPTSDLVRIAKGMASSRGIEELLECAEPYVQHWAMRNNLNIVVFSTAQSAGFGLETYQPPLNIIVRDMQRGIFSDTVIPQAISGKRELATVILTSPTAKTLYLTKSPGHYDKLIVEDDLTALAKQIRQTELMRRLIEKEKESAKKLDGLYAPLDGGFDWNLLSKKDGDPADEFDWSSLAATS